MGKFSFKHFPELVTNRLILRLPHFGDSKSMYHKRTNKKINKLISIKIPQSIAETIKFIDKLNNRFDNSIIFKIKIA